MVSSLLQGLLAAYLDDVRAHSQHALLPIHRRAIYDNFGSLDNRASRRRRGWLDILATRRVVPIWRQARPNDDRAECLVTLAGRVLNDETNAIQAQDEAEEIWEWLMEGESIRGPAFFALGTAVRTVFTTIGDDPWNGMAMMVHETDADIDPWSSDAAKWASSAIAGPVWQPDSDSAKRLEFWTWWLTEAIPAAWEQGA